ncbi:MAG: GH3 auxin-responsive promoter family protein [Muribaculaceae bacterium]|nr:GH3 auxin-responsive promoter family protein [Muribaculaceae bacterium]
MNLTPLLRPYFNIVYTQLDQARSNPEEAQRRLLARLLRKAARTEVGRQYDFASIGSYADYASRVPERPYEDIRPQVMRMIEGEKDVLWPGRCVRYAQSSGTSDGRSKYVPVTDESLRGCHYRGSAMSVASYLHLHPESRMFAGKGLILGGSFATALTDLPKHVKVGDLSAHLIGSVGPGVEFMRVPSRSTALMEDWSKKLPRLISEASVRNVSNLSGVPSWFLTVLRGVLTTTGASEIHEVWPNLEVFFHGGIGFEPYRAQYNAIIDPSRMNYHETYNASEGFFAVHDSLDTKAMLLLTDCGVFFEFTPVDDPSAAPVPCWEVTPGRVYALTITSGNGLWRYPLGDTVRVESVDPLRITIAGRTKAYINAFGEELMVHNADAAITRTCHELDCAVADYTAAPVYTTDRAKGHHQWAVEFSRPPRSLEEFAATLDRHLCDENSDYAAKRSGNIFLAPLELISVPQGTFSRWLASTGKLGGQRKIPRLSNDRRVIDALLPFAR